MRRRLTFTTTLLLFAISLIAQTPTPQDCLGAIPVCQSVIYEPVPGSGVGNYTNEINTSAACVSSESNSIWYTFTANSNGFLNFVITPDDLNDDYDWILFDITNASCADILTDPNLIVSCNAAGGAGCHGATGATGATAFNDQGGGCGANPPSQFAGFSAFNDEVPMVAGNTYVLMVSNWTGSNNGYLLDFSASTGTGIFDTTPPTIANINYPDECDETTIEVEFSEYIQCSTIDNMNFQLTGTGGPYSITLSSNSCDQGGSYDQVFTLTVTPPLDLMGTYTLDLIADGSTEVLDLCNNPAAATSFNFNTNVALNNAPSVIPVVINVCVNENVSIAPIGNNGTTTPVFNFYGDGSLTNLLSTGANYSFTGTVSTQIWVTETLGSCESPPTGVTVNVSAAPDPPSVTPPAPICVGDPTPSLTATGNGGTFTWYASDPSSGSPPSIGTGATFTPSINTNNTGIYNFWVTESLGANCISSPTMVSIEVLDSPPAPSATTTYEVCVGDPVPALTASGQGGTINWYDSDPAIGSPTPVATGSPYTPAINTSFPASYTYWVTESFNPSCQSNAIEVDVTVNAGPSFSSITLTCSPDLLSYTADISFPGADNITVNEGSITNNGGGSFTVSGIDINTTLSVTAENTTTSCSINMDFSPPDCPCPDVDTPVSNGDIQICDGDPIPVLSVTVGPGETVNWYDAASGGNLLAQGTTTFTPPGAGTYYAEAIAIINNCTSTSLTPVTLVIDPLPAMTASTADCAPDLLSYVVTVTISNAASITVNDGSVTDNGGGNFTISGITVNTDLQITATNANGTCSDNFTVPAPDCSCPDVDAPVSNGDIQICDGEAIPDLSVSVGAGETVDWYDAATGGNLLAQGTTIFTAPGPGTYYAETRVLINGCLSAVRTAVTLTINPTPIFISSDASCAPDLLSYMVDIVVTEADQLTTTNGIVSNNGGGNFTISGIDVNVNITVTATVSSTNCSITFDITAPDCSCPFVTPPASGGDVEICEGEAIPPLFMNVNPGETVDWYDAPFGGNLLAQGTTSFTPGSPGTYYAETRVIVNGCLSDIRTAASLTINPLPILNNSTTACSPDLLTYEITLNINNADDLLSSSGTVINNGGGSFTITGIDINTNISVLASNNSNCLNSYDFDAPDCNCPDIDAPVSGGDVNICEGETIPALAVSVGSGLTVNWYDSPAGGNLLLSSSLTFTPTAAGTYYAEAIESGTGCISLSRTAVSLTINPLPVLDDSQATCAADLLTYTVTISLSNADGISPGEGNVTDNGGGSFTISNIDINNPLTITATNSSTGCSEDFNIMIPSCDCPDINPPVSDGDLSYCEGETIPALSVTVGAGETVDWYDAATGGNLLLADSPTYTPTAPGTYYAETREVITDCLSDSRTMVSLTINPLPTVIDFQTDCAVDLLTYTLTINFLDADGITASEGSVIDNGGGSFTISGININNDLTVTATNSVTSCQDDFTFEAPDCNCPGIIAPISDGDITICEGEAIPALTVTVDAGMTVDWYDAATGGSLLLINSTSFTPTAAGSYFAETREITTGCLSPTRTEVILTINPVPALLDAQTDCAIDLLSFTVTVLFSDTDNLTINEGTLVDNGGDSFTISGIDINNDLVITASNSTCSDDFTITAPDCNCPGVTAPVSNGDESICEGEAIPAIGVTVGAGETADWYDAATGGNLLQSDATLWIPPGAGTYYAETREEATGCISTTRTPVTITINPLPTQTATLTSCAPDLLTYSVTITFTSTDNITVSEGSVIDNGSGSFTISGIDVNNNLSITAINSVTTCSDDFIVAAPDCSCPDVSAPVSNGDESICEGEAIPTLGVIAENGVAVDWYDAATGGNLLLSDSPTFTSSNAGTFYAEARVIENGCLSSNRTAITLTINPLPTLIDQQTLCAPDLLTYSATVNFTDANAIIVSEGSVTDNGGGSFTISGVDVNNDLMITAGDATTGCSDDFTIVAPDCPCPDIDAPISDGDLAICEGEPIPSLSVNVGAGETIDWYANAIGGNPILSNAMIFQPTGAGTYYAETRMIVNGCLSSARTPVTLTINPLPVLTNTQTVCAADILSYSATLIFLNTDNITVSEGSITDNGGGSFTITGISPLNDLNVTASNTVTGCSDDFVIQAPDCPCPTITAPVSDGDIAICDNEIIPSLGVSVGAGETVDWYDAATGGNLLLADATSFTPTGAGTFYAETRVITNGCISDIRTPVTLTINATPVLTASTTECSEDLLMYTVNLTISDTDGLSASEGMIVDNGGGSFSVSGVDINNDLMITASNSVTGCSADFTVAAPDCPCPTVSAPLSNGNAAICEGEAIPTLSVATGPGETIDWYDAATGGNLLLADSPTFTPTMAGTYYAETRLTVNNCTSDSRTAVSLTINELPDLQISEANDPGCGIDNGSITLEAIGGQSPYQYQIEGQGFGNDATFENLGANTFNFTVQDDNGCAGTVDMTLVAPVGVTAVANVTDTLTCETTAVAIDGNQTTSDGQVTYEWFFNNASISTEITATVSDPGMYILNAYQDACQSADTIFVQQNLSPGLTAVVQTENMLDCNVTTAPLDGTASSSGSNITYEWYLNDDIIPGASSSTYDATVEGTYELIVTDVHTGCTEAAVFELLNNESYPVANAGEDGVINCYTDNVIADGSNSQAGNVIIYQWLDASGIPIAGATSNTLLLDAAGTYTIMVQDTTNGCSNEDSMIVTADLTPPIAQAGNPMQLDCDESSLSLDGQGSSTGPEYSYTWTADPGGVILNGQQTIEPLIGGEGVYHLLVINTENGCESTDFTTVTQLEVIPTDFSVTAEDADCYGHSNGFISVVPEDQGLQILFSFNDAPFTASSQYSNLTAGSYTVTAEDANGCLWDTTVIIQEGIDMQIDLGEDLFIQLGDAVHLDPQINFPEDNIADINWSNRDLLTCPDCLDPNTVDLINTSSFELIITDDKGCTASDDITVFVDKTRHVFIPNVFSPNDDGYNDIFYIFSRNDVVKVNKFIILNRWGEVLFESYDFNTNNPDYGWDGTFRGRDLNAGVYVYVAEIEFKDGETETYSGDVTLMK